MDRENDIDIRVPRSRDRERIRVRTTQDVTGRPTPSTHQSRELAKQLSLLKRKLSDYDRKNSSLSPLKKKKPAPSRREPHLRLILFYAPWCGHCKRFKPVWEKFVRAMKDKVKTLSVNGDENNEMLQEYNVDKFPTIILEKGKRRKEYDGDMTLEGLKMFIADEKRGNGQEILVL
jgi:thiol-disulfide isomerase/thioredoxin